MTKQNTGAKAPKSTEEAMRALLKRCRSALRWGDAEWEMDVEAAAASDAALALEIDAMLGS